MHVFLLLVLVVLHVLDGAGAHRVHRVLDNVALGEICPHFSANSTTPFHVLPPLSKSSPYACSAWGDRTYTWRNSRYFKSMPIYMYNAPTRVEFTARAMPASSYSPRRNMPKNAPYKASVLILSGNTLLGSRVQAVCDEFGNAFFFPDLITNYEALQLVTMDWLDDVDETIIARPLRGEFDFSLPSLQHSRSAPGFGDALVFTVMVCPTGRGEEHGNAIARNGRVLDFEFDIQLGYSWGKLAPDLFSRLLLLSFTILVKCLLLLRLLLDWQALPQPQHVRALILVMALSIISSLLYVAHLLTANATGVEWPTSGYPSPLQKTLLLSPIHLSNTCFPLLVLATCRGWGVLTDKLRLRDACLLLTILLASLSLFIASQSVGQTPTICAARVMLDLTVWLCIFYSLRQTMAHSGCIVVQRYEQLHSLLVRALLFWCALSCAMFASIALAFVLDNRLDLLNLIPGTLAWELASLYLMTGFASFSSPANVEEYATLK